MTTKTEKNLAKRGEDQLPVIDYGEYSNDSGFEDQDSTDTQIPIIDILQSNSPQLKPENEKFIEGAKPGQLFDTVSNTVIEGPLRFIPAIRQKLYVEWVPRKKGGGLVGTFAVDHPKIHELKKASGSTFGKLRTEEGNDIMETVYLYGISPTSPVPTPYVLAFRSTKLKVLRKWNTALRSCLLSNGNVAPLYAHQVLLSTRPETNAKGDFYNFSIKPFVEGDMKKSLLLPDDELFQAAVALRTAVQGGTAKMIEDTGDQAADEDLTDKF